MVPNLITSQTGGRQFDRPNITKYSLFVGGVNATHHALVNYSPLTSGYGRLFMVRPPKAIVTMFAAGQAAYQYSSENLFAQVKHMIEYMPRSVTGIMDKTLELATTPIEGGFASRRFQTPVKTVDGTTAITIGLFELVGSPIYTVINGWMNAIADENSGLAHYGGYISGGRDDKLVDQPLFRRNTSSIEGKEMPTLEFNEANHTAEFIWVLHDRSGGQVERAILLADCFPTTIQQSIAMDMPVGGTHDNVAYDITFNCVPYQSIIINSIANDLLKQYRVVSNALNFNPELGDAVYGKDNVNLFSRSLGEIPYDSATGTRVGNMPVYDQKSTAKTTTVVPVSINDGKLAGQPGRTITAGDGWDNFEAASAG